MSHPNNSVWQSFTPLQRQFLATITLFVLVFPLTVATRTISVRPLHPEVASYTTSAYSSFVISSLMQNPCSAPQGFFSISYTCNDGYQEVYTSPSCLPAEELLTVAENTCQAAPTPAANGPYIFPNISE